MGVADGAGRELARPGLPARPLRGLSGRNPATGIAICKTLMGSLYAQRSKAVQWSINFPAKRIRKALSPKIITKW
jgi:hypothetical protein